MSDSKAEVKAYCLVRKCCACDAMDMAYDKGDGEAETLMRCSDMGCGHQGLFKITKYEELTLIANNDVSVEEMSQHTIPLVDEFFPKGECQERGKAIVLHARMLIEISKLQPTAINNGVSLEEFRMHVLNVLKKRFPHVGEKSYETIKDAQDEILAKLPTTAPKSPYMELKQYPLSIFLQQNFNVNPKKADLMAEKIFGEFGTAPRGGGEEI